MAPIPQLGRWPELPAGGDARATLHLFTQIAGQIRLMAAPWINHSWHVALYVTVRGLTTSPISHAGGAFDIDFDFLDHVVRIRTSEGLSREIGLVPMPVARFHHELFAALASLGIAPVISGMPNEIADAVPFTEDVGHAGYDRDWTRRFGRILLSVHEVFTRFRSSFRGKVSPVNFFWGSFDLAVTRFSGRTAPRHRGGVPHLPDAVAREAYSHEVSSAGFWPGGGGPIDYPAFYSYAYPAPDGFADASVRPQAAFFATDPGEFILPYDAVPHQRRPRRGADGLPRQHLRGRSLARALGPHRARVPARSGRPPAAGGLRPLSPPRAKLGAPEINPWRRRSRLFMN